MVPLLPSPLPCFLGSFPFDLSDFILFQLLIQNYPLVHASPLFFQCLQRICVWNAATISHPLMYNLWHFLTHKLPLPPCSSADYENPLSLCVCTDKRAREYMSPRTNLHSRLQLSYETYPQKACVVEAWPPVQGSEVRLWNVTGSWGLCLTDGIMHWWTDSSLGSFIGR